MDGEARKDGEDFYFSVFPLQGGLLVFYHVKICLQLPQEAFWMVYYLSVFKSDYIVNILQGELWSQCFSIGDCPI